MTNLGTESHAAACACSGMNPGSSRHHLYQYGVYGIGVRSEFALALPALTEPVVTEVELRLAQPAFFTEALSGAEFQPSPDGWREYAFLSDGSTYVRWPELAEFVASPDGRCLTCG